MADEDLAAVEFWGEEVPAGGKRYSVEIENEPPVFAMIHVTGCALGDDAEMGPHVLKAVYNEKPIPLATLQRGLQHQHALDFAICSATTFINTGASPVYIYGYTTRMVQHVEGSDEEDEDEDEDEEGEDDEPPKLVPLRNAKPGAKKRASPFMDDEADEDEDEDGVLDDDSDEGEDDEDEEGDEYDRRLGAKSFGGRGGGGKRGRPQEDGLPELGSDDLIAEADSDEGEDGEDEGEDEDMDGGEGLRRAKGESSSDDEGEEGDDDGDDSDGPPVERRNAAPKRGAPSATPQPAKKAKQEAPKAPLTAPAKLQQKAGAGKQQQQQQQKQSTGGGDAEAQYLTAIVDYVRSQPGPVPLAALGSKVKRPDAVKARAKAFVLAHADKLVFDEKAQTVALKKK